MKMFYINRIFKLADKLETVPQREFDMSQWKSENGCGTKACACGHACEIPSFRRARLKLVSSMVHSYWDANKTVYTLRFKDNYEFYAAAAFFGMTYSESLLLFSPSIHEKGDDPRKIAKRLRRFAESKLSERQAA